MKCEKCKFRNRPKHIFPCNECDKNKKDIPITCYDCRFYQVGALGCTKDANDIETCENFEWW